MSENKPVMSSRTIVLPLSQIDLVNNHRADEQDGIEELMASIQEQGLLQPVGVVERDGRYKLAFGYRRFTAVKALGLGTIPATIVKAVNDEDLQLINLSENLQRKQVSFAEMGQMIQQLLDAGWSRKVIAKRLGVSVKYLSFVISDATAIPKEYRDLISTDSSRRSGKTVGKLSMRQVNAIASYAKASRLGLTKDERKGLYEAAVKGGPDFDVALIPSYAANLRAGKTWNEDIEKRKNIGNLMFIRQSEAERIEAKYIGVEGSAYKTIPEVARAILRGDLSERITDR